MTTAIYLRTVLSSVSVFLQMARSFQMNSAHHACVFNITHLVKTYIRDDMSQLYRIPDLKVTYKR